MDKRMTCFDSKLSEAGALVEVLANADATVVSHAAEATAGLSPVERCSDVAALMAEVPPPDDPQVAALVADFQAELGQAVAYQKAGKFREGLAIAKRVSENVDDLDYPPIRARAALVRGVLEMGAGDYEGAEVTLTDAYTRNVRAMIVPGAAEASANLVAVVGERLGRPEEGRMWGLHAAALADATGDPVAQGKVANDLGRIAKASGDFGLARKYLERARTLLNEAPEVHRINVAGVLTNLGGIAQVEGDYTTARRLYVEALAVVASVRGEEHPTYAAISNNVGSVSFDEGDYPGARVQFEQTLALQERVLGDAHPDLAPTLSNLGYIAQAQGRPEVALGYLERALAINQAAHGPDHPSVASLLLSFGNVAADQKDFDAADEFYSRSLAIHERVVGPDHPNLTNALASLATNALERNEPSQAQPYLERAAAIWKTADPDNPRAAFTLQRLGDALRMQGRNGEAIPPFERAIEHRTSGPTDQRLLAEARFGLANALWDAGPSEGRDRPRARALATEALAAFAAERVTDESTKEVGAWLAAHPVEPTR